MKFDKSLYIRSITSAIDLKNIFDPNYLIEIEARITKIQEIFKTYNIQVRTFRFNIVPFDGNLIKDENIVRHQIQELANFVKSSSVRWFNISFDLRTATKKQSIKACRIAYEIIKQHENSFVNFIVASEDINPAAILETAKVVNRISRLSYNGYDNFRVGISLNPKKNTPFFPFSFTENTQSFSIALEITQVVERIVSQIPNNYDLAYQEISSQLVPFLQHVENAAVAVEEKVSLVYKGQDISLAPYPDTKVSVVKILQNIGLDYMGAPGTLFLTSVLTNWLKKLVNDANIRSTGFNGVMYSLLEDHIMCAANNKKYITLDSICLYSTLCGCGLDMIPVPGHILDEELASIILDSAALAVRLNKPLGVRLLPIPNGDVNEHTTFDMDFLTNTRIMNPKNISLQVQCFNESVFKYQDIKC